MFSSQNEEPNAERKVRATKVTRPATGTMTNRSTLFRLPSTLPGLMEDDDGLAFLPSLYSELLIQLAGRYASIPQELSMIIGEIVKLTNELGSLSQRMGSAVLTFHGIRMLLDLLKYSVCLSQEMEAWMTEPPCPGMDRKIFISTCDSGPTDSSTHYSKSPAIYHTAHSGLLPISNSLFPVI